MGFVATLRQSTAVNVIIGPFVDSTDGDTEETGLTIAQADVRLSKNAAADAQKNDNTTCAHEGDGFYMCELDAVDTNTVGQLTLWVHVAGALAIRHDFQIVEEAIYDAMFAASATAFNSSGQVSTQGHVKKAAAFSKFAFLMTDSTNHNPATGKSVTVTISKDGGAFASLSSGDPVTEVANGIYEVDLNSTDTNANCIILRATASSCDDTLERIITSI